MEWNPLFYVENHNNIFKNRLSFSDSLYKIFVIKQFRGYRKIKLGYTTNYIHVKKKVIIWLES